MIVHVIYRLIDRTIYDKPFNKNPFTVIQTELFYEFILFYKQYSGNDKDFRKFRNYLSIYKFIIFLSFYGHFIVQFKKKCIATTNLKYK